jgi:Nuclear protein export factor
LRSIRQDLTVQGIHNKFSVEIYQVHVRLALEAQDLDQYNSCMSRLFELYKEGLPGRTPVMNIQEFKAYQIMYYTFQHLYIRLEKCLKTLTASEKQSPEIKEAMALKSFVVLGNYHQVFQIRLKLLHCGPFLLDIFLPKLRANSLIKICKAY